MFGKPWPSSRSKNIALAKEELNRYVSYCPVHEIDPTEKRKKPVVITELHNPPLPARETQRRRHGTYIDLLRPLLLSQQSYDRKMYALFNKLGLFSAYYDELKIRPEANGLIQKGKEDDVNIWRPQFHPQIGEKHYAYLLTRTMKEALKTALDSLQKERILTWRTMTLILPQICMQMENGEDRLEAYAETEERLGDCFCAIHKAAIIPNSCLDEELVCELVRSVYAMPKYKEYKQQQCRNGRMQPFIADDAQVRALDNVTDYLRQCAYQSRYHMKRLLPIADVPQGRDFFGNIYLKQELNRLQREYRRTMLGDITCWQEIHYEVIDNEKALKYCLTDYDCRKADADELTRRFLRKMDGQMQTSIKIKPKDLKGDFGGFYHADDLKEQEITRRLSESKSAACLHEHLQGFYDISIE